MIEEGEHTMIERSFGVSRRAILKSSLWGPALAALPGVTTRAAEVCVPGWDGWSWLAGCA